MKSVTLQNYQSDKYYSRIVKAVAGILESGDVVAPIEVFVRMGLLPKENVERWYKGQVDCLERVIGCNLSCASRILRILQMHAHDLNLRTSQTSYRQWGSRRPLRFSKFRDRNLEEAYSRHFLSPKIKKKPA